eukprot:CAMPEP_0118687654 /NCGR_PEP_ID=MMETSP0800-20121206/8501_1 /TAXON_ID=210618 ORGANISM="Striatella unipunctata, Strain CCMP2910" /NCGR_SAMPLE_ID=MMETSP0800 /ASSEMBLY_ACC=CAM_ASM_000638 /LENGTH=341 /DNA_ID=CAMNT_0006584859 /DNA_START=226 /DNA_END=1251 /DNA_ORIENTATION=+
MGDGARSLSPASPLCSRKGCGTFVVNNGIMDCVLPKSAVPYFCPESGKPTDAARALFRESTSSSSSSSTLGILRRIYRKEGLRGIYAGLAPTLVMSVPNAVLYYTTYDELVSRLRSSSLFYNPWIPTNVVVPLLGGSSARLLASAATAPLELVRTRQAAMIGSGQASFVGTWEQFGSMIRTDGFLSLYRGLGPTLWRDVPFSAIYWLSLEQFRTMLKEQQHNNNHTQDVEETVLQRGMRSFISGAAAGMIAAACTTPFDVVKTRRQVTPTTTTTTTAVCDCGVGTVALNEAELNTFAYMWRIYQTEGLGALWQGNAARMFKVAPACAIMITCYEIGKTILA